MKNMTWSAALAVLLLAALPAQAQWIEDGNAICNAIYSQNTVEIIPDGKGGAIMVWQDYRADVEEEMSDIYAQRVDKYGKPLWLANGVAICTADSSQLYPKIISDGACGAVIVWQDERNGSGNANIYAQRVDSSGNTVWAANGAVVCDTSNKQQYPAIVPDGTGGAIIAWSDYRNGSSYDIYAQRIVATGTTVWGRNGMAVCNAANHQTGPVMATDNFGGAVIVWQDYRSGTNYDIYAQRVLGNGTVKWTVNGVTVCDTTGNQRKPAIAADYIGGAQIVWQDDRSGSYDIYAQWLMWYDGSRAWTKNGEMINNMSGNQQNPAIVCISDFYTHTSLIAYETAKNGNYDIEIVKIDNAGKVVTGWPATWSPYDESKPKMVVDGMGGAFVTWMGMDYSTNSYDIFACRANYDVEKTWWQAQSVCHAAGGQLNPAICTDDAGGVFIAWQDGRNGSDIYAQRLDGYDGSYSGHNAPTITGIGDIPNDQGGYVNLQWTPSALDAYPDTTISFYSLWRSLTGDAAKSLISKGAKLVEPSDITIDFTGPAYRLTELDSKSYAWEWIANIPWKHYLTAYSYPMPTLCDTMTGEMAWHHFFVSAQTDNPLVYWDSYPDSGYSVDDLAPAKVVGLDGETSAGLVLTWESNSESDLRDYAVYCNGTLVGFTTDTNYTYTGSLNTNDCFTISAYDIHNNEGIVSDQWIYLGPQAVHLSFFTVGQTNEAVELRWRTESEENSQWWLIERKTAEGGGAYDRIGTMTAQGSSNVPHEYSYQDRVQLVSGRYMYRIAEVSTAGDTVYYGPVTANYRPLTPQAFALAGAYPNPSRGQTVIQYQLPRAADVIFQVYNIAGQLVKTVDEGQKPAGYHQIILNENVLSNGVYFYRLTAGSFGATGRLTVIK